MLRDEVHASQENLPCCGFDELAEGVVGAVVGGSGFTALVEGADFWPKENPEKAPTSRVRKEKISCCKLGSGIQHNQGLLDNPTCEWGTTFLVILVRISTTGLIKEAHSKAHRRSMPYRSKTV